MLWSTVMLHALPKTVTPLNKWRVLLFMVILFLAALPMMVTLHKIQIYFLG